MTHTRLRGPFSLSLSFSLWFEHQLQKITGDRRIDAVGCSFRFRFRFGRLGVGFGWPKTGPSGCVIGRIGKSCLSVKRLHNESANTSLAYFHRARMHAPSNDARAVTFEIRSEKNRRKKFRALDSPLKEKWNGLFTRPRRYMNVEGRSWRNLKNARSRDGWDIFCKVTDSVVSRTGEIEVFFYSIRSSFFFHCQVALWNCIMFVFYFSLYFI